MRRFKFVAIIALIVACLFGGLKAKADTILPGTFVTDDSGRIHLDYIKYTDDHGNNDTYSLYYKYAKDGTTVYCIELPKKYIGGMTYTKTGTMDVGINYILKNKPNTGDKYKDFYITQMAVYFYQDWINGNDNNLQEPFKKLIVAGAKLETDQLDDETKDICKKIYNLYIGATHYRNNTKYVDGYIDIKNDSVTFTEQDGYFVSSKIYVESNIDKLNKTMVNATPNTKIYRDTDDKAYVVKIPVTDIPEGMKVTFSLRWEGDYDKEVAYYYYANDTHQKLVYDKLEQTTNHVQANIELTVKNFIESYSVKISKTDVTQTKEVPGATLELKDAKGNLVETWVSTSESHKIVLKEGEYSLTETIAPEGYRLSTTTIYFKLDANGKLYAKVKDQYVQVEKINMINELKDVTSIVKKDKKTNKYLAGATLVVKDANGTVMKEFVSNDSVYQLVLQPGDYTIEEIAAPKGYILSKEKLSFRVLVNGALQVKNSNGVYEDSVMVEFYNSPEQNVDVPPTGASGMIVYIAGLTLVISGVVYAIKTAKEC